MEKWWTIIAKNSGVATWRLTGDIGKWQDISANSFSSELDALEPKHSTINMILHSGGGSITEGINMYYRAKRSQSEINIDVEGIAASMGSALLMAGKKRRMARHSQLMLHQGKGGIKGSANQILEYALQLKKWNNTLADIYAEAIAWKHPERDAKWVKENWLAEGKDTWFTAQEAKDAGLIHEIYDSSSPIESAPASASYEEMVAHYDQRINGGNPPSSNNSKMKKEQLLLMFAGVGITFGDDVTASMEDDDFLAQVKAELKKLKKKADTADSLQAQVDAQGETDFEAKLTECVSKGVITEKQKGHYRNLAKDNNHTEVVALLDDMLEDSDDPNALDEGLKKKPKKGVDNPERKEWDYRKWEEEDPKGLLALADDDPEAFAKLLEDY